MLCGALAKPRFALSRPCAPTFRWSLSHWTCTSASTPSAKLSAKLPLKICSTPSLANFASENRTDARCIYKKPSGGRHTGPSIMSAHWLIETCQQNRDRIDVRTSRKSRIWIVVVEHDGESQALTRRGGDISRKRVDVPE